ncbi:ABC transporter ATP-binding protein [Vallitalea maricola]|uniref:ABC transporter ATP-binding protein n=1 Tax=Vallitalea maricola TaxID=3074433 RepID=A0ACB5UDE0_9FIRM|nr:ABC transporter ATP-binding protein [Vallitalea sp. AN17-2]
MILKTSELTKKYGTQFAVSNVSIHVKKGEVYGLLGRNGAGKTTTLRMVMGLLQPSSGEVLLFGEKLITPTKKCFRRIGALIESPAFYENLTAKENLEIISDLRGTQSKEAVGNALALVNLDKETKKKVKQFSLGMKQRLGIAMALMHEPEFIILDEPANGLDPVGIQQIRLLIKKLSVEKGITVLISSHILSEIEQMADTIGIIDNGQLIEEISMDEIKRRNRHYVKMTVSNIGKTIPILEKELNITDFEVIDEKGIKIYQIEANFEDINRHLNNAGVGVSEISLNKGNLEEYFLKLTGGVSIG